MNTTLKELYHGNIQPNVKDFLQDSSYGIVATTVTSCEQQLLTLCKSDEKALLEKMMVAARQERDLQAENAFIDGYRIGARLAIETFYKNDGDLF